MFKKTTVLAATLLTATAATAGVGIEWDNNKDEQLSLQEFTQGYEEMSAFKMWDTDGDNMLSQAEFADGWSVRDMEAEVIVWNQWDKDASGMVDASEFHEGLFNIYDVNGDANLSEVEVSTLMTVMNGDQDS